MDYTLDVALTIGLGVVILIICGALIVGWCRKWMKPEPIIMYLPYISHVDSINMSTLTPRLLHPQSVVEHII